MAKKLEGNGLFESSRMILPEHREAYNQYMIHKDPRPKPVIDEQEWQQIGQALQDSFNRHVPVTLELYDPYEDKQATGFVTVINMFRREIKFQQSDDWEWVRFKDILSAQK